MSVSQQSSVAGERIATLEGVVDELRAGFGRLDRKLDRLFFVLLATAIAGAGGAATLLVHILAHH